MENLPNLDLLNELLRNYMSEMEEAIAVAICDRDGFIIASESREEKNGDDSVIGAISAFLDVYIDRIKNEFQTQSNFFNITSMKEKKFAYCSMGPKSILTTIAEPATSDIELKVFSEHIAGKIELILEGNNDISIDIPEIIRVLSRSRGGNLPKGIFTLKLILIGDYSVGKTSLIKRFVENRFSENYISTIGVNISKKTIKMAENTEVQLLLWDIAGQISQMAPYRKRFYEGANAAFIVVDRSRGNYDTSIQKWYDDIKNAIPANIPIVIAGNKSDLKEQNLTTKEEIKELAEKLGFHYILTSAKTGENVNEAFSYIAYRFIERV